VMQDLHEAIFTTVYEWVKNLIMRKNDLTNIKQLQEQFSKFSYKQIELVLKMLTTLLPKNERLFELLAHINVNPIKILLFQQLWTVLQSS
jgi:fido (protein-threonine AMPylation protein)